MASFVQDGLFLIPISGFGTGSGNQVAFTGTSGLTAVLVAFHQIVQERVSPTPSSALCPLKEYVVRVILPNSSTINILAPGTTTNAALPRGISPNREVSGTSSNNIQFSLISNPNLNQVNRQDVVIFQPFNEFSPIMVNQNFSGRLFIKGQTFSGQYQVVPRSDFASAGYSAELPILLSNCAICGCQSGYQCYSTGICQLIADTCPADAVCGQNNGTCSGECFANNGYTSQCQLVSGGYQCVINQSRTVWDYAIFAIVLLILLLVIFYFIGMIFYRSTKPIIEEYQYQPVGSPEFRPDPCQPNGGTWYQLVQPVIEPLTVNTYTLQPVTTVVTDSSGQSRVINSSNLPVYAVQ